MIIYNVTVNIDETVHQEWLDWMNTKHIAQVMNTGLFTAAKMSKVLVEEQMGGLTYSIQPFNIFVPFARPSPIALPTLAKVAPIPCSTI